ncbi:hypothetical protein EOA22_17090 [Mesorhizobium sp. M7A.F.Ca.US.014.04.1.1]|uniref:Uncharacterized protein n=1 Tax=Mesorhizobium ciceri biovar biserrulae (strain HAMBI 2942 / LMG 23838 / WSM1271) TaxID=765698 RepID=E8TKK8_MESCW|nr:hypothetical protein Mesci_4719 [Mesorhizobium ciceri biovar biserrulae WSM1271]RUU20657.1 hypothetical protein EOC84_12830 [Mesorhizobium sp. Primo-B]RUU39254.1 hypothetical protein EOC83_12065 [Mesorhizobium sp. Primo-A]RUX11856.1 hypothetical protein EN996_25790 [Mesorhizobium sp. M7A.F.Ca.CA.002.14.1.2]RUX39268.1 hypothetical protein EN987_12515 [Mesorhizobium sp. M7A.F.Ca.CA.002.11.2.1]RUX55234.1 hypothetical protein EN994_10630 [Mesorhizobium sp. M7A.F.Ca.CA.002.09.1.1]RUX59239.1 hyp
MSIAQEQAALSPFEIAKTVRHGGSMVVGGLRLGCAGANR